MVLMLAGCGHDSKPTTVVAPAAAATDVPREAAADDPAVTEPAAPKVETPKVKASKVKAPKVKAPKKPVRKASPPGSGSAALDRFVTAVQQKLPEVALDRRDEEVEDLGEQSCQALGNGRSATVAAGEVAEQGVAPADARTLVGLARDNLCRA